MGYALLLLLFSGPLAVIALLVGFWKYLLAVVGIAVGLHLAGRIQERLQRRRQRREL